MDTVETTKEKALQRANNILDVEEHNMSLLTELTQIQSELLAEMLGKEIPDSLIFIVVETTIARYRKVGAEGMSTKKLDVISSTYSDDMFEPYREIIARHSDKSTNKIVRLI